MPVVFSARKSKTPSPEIITKSTCNSVFLTWHKVPDSPSTCVFLGVIWFIPTERTTNAEHFQGFCASLPPFPFPAWNSIVIFLTLSYIKLKLEELQVMEKFRLCMADREPEAPHYCCLMCWPHTFSLLWLGIFQKIFQKKSCIGSSDGGMVGHFLSALSVSFSERFRRNKCVSDKSTGGRLWPIPAASHRYPQSYERPHSGVASGDILCGVRGLYPGTWRFGFAESHCFSTVLMHRNVLGGSYNDFHRFKFWPEKGTRSLLHRRTPCSKITHDANQILDLYLWKTRTKEIWILTQISFSQIKNSPCELMPHWSSFLRWPPACEHFLRASTILRSTWWQSRSGYRNGSTFQTVISCADESMSGC